MRELSFNKGIFMSNAILLSPVSKLFLNMVIIYFYQSIQHQTHNDCILQHILLSLYVYKSAK